MNTVNRRHGYARTSTAKGQSTDVQEEILSKAGCHHIFTEQVSGTSTKDGLQLKPCCQRRTCVLETLLS